MSNRQGAQAFILEYIEKIAPGGANAKLWSDRFATMGDKEFDTFMIDIEAGREMLAVIMPNFSDTQISLENNFKLAKELNHEFFERIRIPGGDDGSPAYLTPEKYLVTLQVLRRQAQLLVKKISIPQDNRSINDLTGQPSSMGSSRGSKISYPELQILAALDLNDTSIETIKYRGGDVKGFAAMNRSISQTGGASLRALDKAGTRVKSTQTLQTYLTCMHYEVDI